MKYIKLFDTTANMNAAIANSTIGLLAMADNNGNPVVKIKKPSPVPPTPSHDYVEIAGIKWATMNVGANTIYEPGLYFQWGDTQGYTADQVYPNGQKKFECDDYKYYDTELKEYTKYTEEDIGEEGITTLETEDDAVTAAWGGNWRMPTREELNILQDDTKVTQEYVQNYQNSGVGGFIITDIEDNSKFIFIPDCNTFGLWGSCYIWGRNGNGSGISDCLTNSDSQEHLYNVGMDCFNGAPMRGVLAQN